MLKVKVQGGDTVKKGNYWNLVTGERVHMEKAGPLAGTPDMTYFRFHPAFMLFLGPVFGLVYAIFLPFIGIAMLLQLSTKKVAEAVTYQFRKIAFFNWSPSAAYFKGKDDVENKNEECEKNHKK